MNGAGSASRWSARAAATWMAIFGAVHVYWAFGGGLGLPSDVRVPDDPMLLAVDVIAIPLCAAGMALALTLERARSPKLGRWATLGAWATAALLLLHAAPAVPEWLALAVTPEPLAERDRYALLLYEPWWLAGGLIFALAAFLGGRRRLRA